MSAIASAATILHLVLGPGVVIPDLPLADVWREVRAIWAPHLQVVTSSSPLAAAAGQLTVELRTADPVRLESSSPGPSAQAIGWIEFVNGVPRPVVIVSPARARQLADAVVIHGERVARLPASIRHHLSAVALGRAIAHELGHFLLRSLEHAPHGLMRAGLRPQDVVVVGGSRFRLMPDEQRRLTALLAAVPQRAALHAILPAAP
ncbi:MAG: hypothetical protein AB7N65_19465 [Vicinamibacterales bacterium]